MFESCKIFKMGQNNQLKYRLIKTFGNWRSDLRNPLGYGQIRATWTELVGLWEVKLMLVAFLLLLCLCKTSINENTCEMIRRVISLFSVFVSECVLKLWRRNQWNAHWAPAIDRCQLCNKKVLEKFDYICKCLTFNITWNRACLQHSHNASCH